MLSPVIAADGHTYERAAMQAWLTQHDTSPVTGQRLPHLYIVNNLVIRNAIGQHAGVTQQSDLDEQLRHCF